MIKCHLSRILGERKLKIADVARGIEVHRNALTLMYYERAKQIDLEVIDKLCKYLNCSVCDLFEYKEKE